MKRYDDGEPDQALREIRLALARVDNGAPSASVTSKRELWALHEALLEHVGDQFHDEFDIDTYQVKRGSGQVVRTFRQAQAQSFATGVAPGSFRSGLTMGMPFAAAAEEFLEHATLELVDDDTTVLRHPVLTTVVRRAAALMDALPAGENDIHTRLDGESPSTPENDRRFVLRAMRGGMRTGALIGISSLAPLPEFEVDQAKTAAGSGKEPSAVTVTKVARIAGASSALARTPASLNGAETHAFSQDLPDNEYQRNPELWERGASDNSVRYVKDLRRRIADARQENGEDPATDQFGLVQATLGCPALKEIRGDHEVAGLLRRMPPQLMRLHAVAIAMMERHWKLTVPSRPPLDLGALGVPDDRHYSQIVLTDLPGVKVRTLPSDTGLVHLVASDDTLAARLRIARDGDMLHIDGAGRDEREQLGLTIHTPFPSGVTASGVPYLDLEYCDRVSATMVAGGFMRACLMAGREYAAPSLGLSRRIPAGATPERHRVESASGATVLVYSDLAGAAELNRAPGDNVTVVSDFDWQPYETPTASSSHVPLDSMTAETLRTLPVAVRHLLRRNESWLARHAYGPVYDERRVGQVLRAGAPDHAVDATERFSTPRTVLPSPRRHRVGDRTAR